MKYCLPNFTTSNFTKLTFLKYAMTNIHHNKSRGKVIPKKLKSISVNLISFKVTKKKKGLKFLNYLTKISSLSFTSNALCLGNRWSIKIRFGRHIKLIHVNRKSAKMQYWSMRKWVDSMRSFHSLLNFYPVTIFLKRSILTFSKVLDTARFFSIKPIIVCTSNVLIFFLQLNQEFVFDDPMFSSNVIKNSQGWSFWQLEVTGQFNSFFRLFAFIAIHCVITLFST